MLGLMGTVRMLGSWEQCEFWGNENSVSAGVMETG